MSQNKTDDADPNLFAIRPVQFSIVYNENHVSNHICYRRTMPFDCL